MGYVLPPATSLVGRNLRKEKPKAQSLEELKSNLKIAFDHYIEVTADHFDNTPWKSIVLNQKNSLVFYFHGLTTGIIRIHNKAVIAS